MSGVERVSKLIREELAFLVTEEIQIENGFITISYVELSPDLNNAKIGISVLPDNLTGTALKNLRKNTAYFAKILKKKTRLRKIPRIEWVVDATEREAAKIDEIFKNLE